MSVHYVGAWYAGTPDRELDAALDAAARGKATWAGDGEDQDGCGVERAWLFNTRELAEAALSRIASGVTRAGLRLRIRQRGLENGGKLREEKQ